LTEGFRQNWRSSAKAFGVFLICIFPLLVRVFLIEHANPSDLNFFSRSDPQWIEIIKQRDSYIFFSIWGRDAFLSLATYFAILLAILLFRRWYNVNELNKSEQRQEYSGNNIRESDLWAYGVIIVCAGLFIIGGVFVEWYPLPLVVQLQVVRSSYLLVNLAIIYVAWLLWEGAQRSRKYLAIPATIYSLTHPRPLPRGEFIRRFLGSSIGKVIPVFIATLFMTQSTNQLILGSVTLFFWWLSFHLERLHFLLRAAIGLAWLVIILWFRGFFLEALDWRLICVVLMGFVFIEFAYSNFSFLLIKLFFQTFLCKEKFEQKKRRGKEKFGWKGWRMLKRLTAGCLLITTVLALITFNFSKLNQILTKGQFTHQINLPGKLPRSDWIDVRTGLLRKHSSNGVKQIRQLMQNFLSLSIYKVSGPIPNEVSLAIGRTARHVSFLNAMQKSGGRGWKTCADMIHSMKRDLINSRRSTGLPLP
jgi:hypothetical protein